MQEFIAKFIEYGYLILFIYSLGGGMLALAALAAFSATSASSVQPALAIACASSANFLGALALFWLCKNNKKDFAKHLNKHRRKIALLVLYFRKNGFLLTLVCKFLYGFKTIAPIAAELAKMSYLKYSIYNAISSLIWGVVVFFTARAASEQIIKLSEKFSTLHLAGGFLILLVCVVLLINKISKKGKDAKAA